MPEIQMPKLSDTMTEGTLVSWKKKIGDQVTAGEVLAEIETDKATMEWESTEDGVLKEIYVQEGGKVNVGERIAFIGGEGEEAEEAEEKEPAPAAAKEAPPAEKPPAKAPPPKEDKPSGASRVKASPLAKKIAAEKGVDLTSLKGTGPGGRIVEKDVEAAVSAAGPSEAPAKKTKTAAPEISAGETARISLTGMRKVIAERLASSLGPIPHFYLNIEINADALMRIRAELKSGGEDDDATKITVNDFILKGAVVAALREPKVNAAFDGDAIIQYGDINLAVAVAIDEGLVTPVIRDCAKQVAPRNQRRGQRPRPPRAQQANEAGGIPGRHPDRLKPRELRDRLFLRHHQPAPGHHPLHRRDREKTGREQGRRDRSRLPDEDRDELRPSRGRRRDRRQLPESAPSPAGKSLAPPPVQFAFEVLAHDGRRKLRFTHRHRDTEGKDGIEKPV